MSSFSAKWAHAFAGGKKGPWVLAINTAPPQPDWVGEVDGKPMRVVEDEEPSLNLLGVTVDADLSFAPLLKGVLGRLAAKGRTTPAGLASTGFGLPLQVDQLDGRVHQTVLQGSELLASYHRGWRAAAAAMTHGQYGMAKDLLGVPRATELGGFARVFLELRMEWRLGTHFARRVIMARARMELLPPDHPLSKLVDGVEAAGVSTWWEHAREVRTAWGIEIGAREFAEGRGEGRTTPEARRKKAQEYKRRIVLPRFQERESEWFRSEIQKAVANGRLNHPELAPARSRWLPSLRWAEWGPTHWKYYRAWVLVRLTGGIPLTVWDAGEVMAFLPRCPLCGHASAGVIHLALECRGVEDVRAEARATAGAQELTEEWLLQGGAADAVRIKVRLLGRAVGRVVAERRRRWAEQKKESQQMASIEEGRGS